MRETIYPLINLSTDPDGDDMTYLWTITGPNGYYSKTFTTKNPTIPGSVTENHAGNYTVKLHVEDEYGLAADSDAVKTITVLPLGITGAVNHTDEWLANLNEYNDLLDDRLAAGSLTTAQYNDRYRELTDFWAGERFVLAAQTTTIASGSSVKALQVWTEVEGSTYPDNPQSPWYVSDMYLDRDLYATNTPPTKWAEAVNDPSIDLTGVSDNIKLEQLQNGILNFTFYVKYNNGVIKSTVVPVNVKGKWTDFYQLHRVK